MHLMNVLYRLLLSVMVWPLLCISGVHASEQCFSPSALELDNEFFYQVFVDRTASAKEMNQPSFKQLISPNGIASLKSPILVDLRSKTDFQSAHIPNSIHMSHQGLLQADQYRNETIVLVGEQLQYPLLVDLAKALKGRNFQKIYILAGGLQAWRSYGKPLAGQMPSVQNQLSVAKFIDSLAFSDWFVLDVNSGESVPNHRNITEFEQSKLSRLIRLLRKEGNTQYAGYLLLDSDGKAAKTIWQSIPGDARPYFYYFTHGVQDYYKVAAIQRNAGVPKVKSDKPQLTCFGVQ